MRKSQRMGTIRYFVKIEETSSRKTPSLIFSSGIA